MKQDIVQFLAHWLRFADASSRADNLAAYCPFHKEGKEENPGLYVYVGRPTHTVQPGTAYCHTCGRGWTLPMLLRGLGADYALVQAAQEISQENAPATKPDPITQLDFSNPQLPEQVLAVFDYGPRALLEKGFSAELLRQNDVGFDRDRQRITFGIRDHLGRLVGVSGRSVIGEEPRYKIYRSEFHGLIPGYELEKNRVVWGLDKIYQTRLHFGDDSPLIVCEGFKACLWVKQAGYENAVALMGVSLSTEQATLITRVSNEVILFLDNNQAGRKATEKHIRTLKGVDLRVVNYGTTHDMQPDNYALARVRELIENAEHTRSFR